MCGWNRDRSLDSCGPNSASGMMVAVVVFGCAEVGGEDCA